MLQEFAEIRAVQGKLSLVDGICEQLAPLNTKLSEHTVRLDQVQMKVNLSCDTLVQVQQQHQFQGGQRAKQHLRAESLSPTASDGSEGILGAAPRLGVLPSPRQVQVSAVPPVVQNVIPVSGEDVGGKRQWMPKMDFPRFDGSMVRVWPDKCEAFFQLYHIRDNFKVASASLHLSDNAAHWY